MTRIFHDRYNGQAPCPHCFESSGYVWEHGNDWNSGPWSHQTNIPCSYCDGTGSVEDEPMTLDDMDEAFGEEALPASRDELKARDEIKRKEATR